VGHLSGTSNSFTAKDVKDAKESQKMDHEKILAVPLLFTNAGPPADSMFSNFSFLSFLFPLASLAVQLLAAFAAPVPAMRPNTAPETSPVPLG
jgi:hypothetical protein